jgi:alcohol dehydrogenase
MQPFDYQPRTRVVFGAGSLERLGEIARSLGGHRLLVVSDPGIVAAGYAGRAVKMLETAGLETVLFDGVEENPTTRHVDAGLRFAAPHHIDLIVGLGGGSSMDCAKGVNFLLTNGGRIADYWGSGKASKPLLPMIAVPTTAGTGSEAQSFALIADEHTHQKMACGDRKAMAAVAILDAELTLTQPAQVTADTGIDAISHALETWVTKRRNPLSMLFSQEAWRLLSVHFVRVLDDPGDLEARAAMQLGAFYAGTAIENSMLGAAHSCANPLTAHFDVVHGAAVGVMLPAVIRFNGPSAGALYGELTGSRDGAETLASRIESLLQRAALPTRLSEYKIPEDALPDLAREASTQWTAQFNPRPVTENDLLEIYRCVY